MSQVNQQSGPAVVPAIYINTEQQRRAFQVLDAVDELDCRLGAYRAVAQLAQVEHMTADESLPQLRRGDFAALLNVLNSDISIQSAKLRTAAMFSASGSPSGAEAV